VPSLWYENTPFSALEALQVGLPVVGSDLGGIAEIVQHEHNGLLFPAGDAAALAATIERVLASRDRWGEVLHNARRFVESERTWARSVSRYADVYGAVLRHAARTPAAHVLPGA
jgi:glycosyltransferase involved in cell wall biosynthesis